MTTTWPRTRVAIACMFFVNGMLFSTWVSRIPSVKQALGLSDARLGVALLAITGGIFVSLPLTGRLIGRFGSFAMMRASAIGCAGALPLAGAAASFAPLMATLALYGASLGAMDVAMNAQAALFERSAARSVMSSFHALWSLGGLVGSSLGAGFAARDVTPAVHFLVACAGLVVLAFFATLSPSGHARDETAAPARLTWPSRAVLVIGLVGACGAIVEGGVADWSGVYLRDRLAQSAGFAATAYAAFALAMMIGRFAGDRLIDRFGRTAILRAGALGTGVAIAVPLLWPRPDVALCAFALAGLCVSSVFPIAFSAAGSLAGPPGQAIAAVATMAYGGGMAGPPVIGFVAQATSLRAALWLLVLGALGIAALAARLAPPRSS